MSGQRAAYTVFTGPTCMVAGCNQCNHVEREERARKPGKAWGWTARNAVSKRMRAHIREKHGVEP